MRSASPTMMLSLVALFGGCSGEPSGDFSRPPEDLSQGFVDDTQLQDYAAKLDYLEVGYEIEESRGVKWIVWTEKDSELVSSVRHIPWGEEISQQLYLLETAGLSERYIDTVTQSAESGNPDAQYLLGLGLVVGNNHFTQDYDAAFSWLSKAAANSHPAAPITLGVMYENGWGVIQDFEEALSQFRTAASRGEGMAYCKIGFYYQQGVGVTRDKELAYQNFSKAKDSKADCSIPGLAPNSESSDDS